MIHDHQSVARLLNCILQIWKCVNRRPLWSIINDKKTSFGLDIVGQLSLFFITGRQIAKKSLECIYQG